MVSPVMPLTDQVDIFTEVDFFNINIKDTIMPLR